MSYVVPQVQVFQEFNLVPAAIVEPLRAMIAGPNCQLVRYTVSTEKASGLLGAYDPANEVCHAWPNRVAGAVVDLDYTRIFIDNAILQYFNSASVVSADVQATFCDVDLGGYKNRIRSPVINWKTYGSDVRNALLRNRDVQLGDSVKVTASVDGEVVTFWSYVAGFVHEVVGSTVGSPYANAANQGATTESASGSQVAGTDNGVILDAASAAAYDGLADGNPEETYVVEVIQGSTGGDPTTALLSVTSASGNDDVAAVAPSAWGVATAIGARGATATFDQISSSSMGVGEGSSSSLVAIPADFVVGQRWEIDVAQDFAVPVPAKSGTYTGTGDTTYIVEVSNGGTFAGGLAQVMVSTTTGIDNGGPFTIGAGGAVVIGSGVTLTFTGTAVCKGDIWYTDVVAAHDGAAKTLVLGNNLPDGLLGVTDGVCGSVPYLNVTLYIKKSIEVEENRMGYAPLVNWEAKATEVCIKDGIVAWDSTWTDDLGTLLAMPVMGGTVYVHYRAFLTSKAAAIWSISDVGNIASELGVIDPDNPLAYAVSKALANSNGTDVKYMATMGNTVIAYQAVVDQLIGRKDVYSLVPLTFDRSIQNIFAAHAQQMSGPTVGRWRRAIVCSPAVEEIGVLVAAHNGSALLATVSDDPAQSATQYTFLEISTPTGQTPVSLVTAGVRAGDIVRAQYVADGFGGQAYSEYVVDAVLSEESLRLFSGPAAAIPVASKIEIWRPFSTAEMANYVKLLGGSFGSRRVTNVWPDYITSGGVAVPGFHLAAAIAGLRSGIVPQQGMTNLEIAGFDAVPRTVDLFNSDQLDDLAEAGNWVVTQDPITGQIFTRHALTTDTTDLNSREEMVTANVDAISYYFLNELAPFIGISNITPALVDQIHTECKALISYLESSTFVERLGGQLVHSDELGSTTIVSIARHPTMFDRLVIVINLVIPYPLNVIECHLVI